MNPIIECAITESIASKLEQLKPRHRLEVHRSPASYFSNTGLSVFCERCGNIPIEISGFPGAFEIADHIENILEQHLHPAPRRLTRRQRELVKVGIIHRHGAWRLASCLR